MSKTCDIPARIAKVLFVIGCVWAALLIVPTLLAFAPLSGAWPLGVYLLAGYTVWFSWLWRFRYLPHRSTAVGLWLCSVAVNGFWPIFIIATHESWPEIILFSSIAFVHWWWVIVTAASLTALVFEFGVERDEMRPAKWTGSN